jgi:hypothetical protein
MREEGRKNQGRKEGGRRKPTLLSFVVSGSTHR